MKQITATNEHHFASSKLTLFLFCFVYFPVRTWDCGLVWLSNNTKNHPLILYYAIDMCVSLWQNSGQKLLTEQRFLLLMVSEVTYIEGLTEQRHSTHGREEAECKDCLGCGFSPFPPLPISHPRPWDCSTKIGGSLLL